MRAANRETGNSKLFSVNTTADDPNEMITNGNYYSSQSGLLLENCAFLVDRHVAGGTAETCARRNFPQQFLHYHRSGHRSVTSTRAQRGYAKTFAFTLQDDETDGPYYRQEWEGMKLTT